MSAWISPQGLFLNDLQILGTRCWIARELARTPTHPSTVPAFSRLNRVRESTSPIGSLRIAFKVSSEVNCRIP